MIDKELLAKVVSGEIEDPVISIDIDGQPFSATGIEVDND